MTDSGDDPFRGGEPPAVRHLTRQGLQEVVTRLPQGRADDWLLLRELVRRGVLTFRVVPEGYLLALADPLGAGPGQVPDDDG